MKVFRLGHIEVMERLRKSRRYDSTWEDRQSRSLFVWMGGKATEEEQKEAIMHLIHNLGDKIEKAIYWLYHNRAIRWTRHEPFRFERIDDPVCQMRLHSKERDSVNENRTHRAKA
jgi:hypothetical protein